MASINSLFVLETLNRTTGAVSQICAIYFQLFEV